MKKFSKFLFSFFVIILISSLIPFSVNAQSYYNHFQNSSFVTITDICEHGDFENNAFDDGEVYGNWTNLGSSVFDAGGVPVGSSQYEMWVENLKYDIVDEYEPLGADVVNITFYGRWSNLACDIRVYFYYTDASNDYFDYDLTNTYTEYSIIDDIDITKTLDYLQFGRVGTGVVFIDLFSIELGGSQEQDSISLNTEPWYTLATPQYNFGSINEAQGVTDTYSVQWTGISFGQGLGQDISYLDSDSIYYIDCYIKSADVANGDGLRCQVAYSDGTYSNRDRYVTTNGSDWEYVNFGVSFIDSDKYIVSVYFMPLSDESSYDWMLDDFGLWSSVPTGFSRFGFALSPSPIDYGSFSVELYAGQGYTFSGFVYNLTDNELNENGTFSFNTNFGSVSGYVVNGQFNVSVSSRSYTTSPYTIEVFSIVIVIGSQVDVFEIDVYWYPTTGSSTDTPIISTDFISNWFIIAIFLIVIPLGATVYIGFQIASEPNPALMLVTFMAFETIMGAVSLASGVINIWVMLVIIIVDVLIIMGLLKTK